MEGESLLSPYLIIFQQAVNLLVPEFSEHVCVMHLIFHIDCMAHPALHVRAYGVGIVLILHGLLYIQIGVIGI